jgi:triosephosphate isomerase
MSVTRRGLVAGNWKMHGSRVANASLVAGVLAALPAGADCVLCPPAVYLADVAAALAGSSIGLGAQDVSPEAAQGAYTGEWSGAMLRDVGCSHVIVGHSERRARHGESDALVARKTAAALAAGLVPIVCVGETLEERDAGATAAVVGRSRGAGWRLSAPLSSPTSRSGRSAPGGPRPRSRLRRSTPCCVASSALVML